MTDIKLSPNHGVNPSLDMCFWCGESKGILLLGQLENDVEAPREMLTSYEPCDKCAELFTQGVHIIEVTTNDNDIPPITSDGEVEYYPTGKYAVIKRESDFVTSMGITGDNICLKTDVYSQVIQSAND